MHVTHLASPITYCIPYGKITAMPVPPPRLILKVGSRLQAAAPTTATVDTLLQSMFVSTNWVHLARLGSSQTRGGPRLSRAAPGAS